MLFDPFEDFDPVACRYSHLFQYIFGYEFNIVNVVLFEQLDVLGESERLKELRNRVLDFYLLNVYNCLPKLAFQTTGWKFYNRILRGRCRQLDDCFRLGFSLGLRLG